MTEDTFTELLLTLHSALHPAHYKLVEQLVKASYEVGYLDGASGIPCQTSK